MSEHFEGFSSEEKKFETVFIAVLTIVTKLENNALSASNQYHVMAHMLRLEASHGDVSNEIFHILNRLAVAYEQVSVRNYKSLAEAIDAVTEAIDKESLYGKVFSELKKSHLAQRFTPR